MMRDMMKDRRAALMTVSAVMIMYVRLVAVGTSCEERWERLAANERDRSQL